MRLSFYNPATAGSPCTHYRLVMIQERNARGDDENMIPEQRAHVIASFRSIVFEGFLNNVAGDFGGADDFLDLQEIIHALI